MEDIKPKTVRRHVKRSPSRRGFLRPNSRKYSAQTVAGLVGNLTTHTFTLKRVKKQVFTYADALIIVPLIIALLVGLLSPLLEKNLNKNRYNLTSTHDSLLPVKNPKFAELIKYDGQNKVFKYNENFSAFSGGSDSAEKFGGAKIQASFAEDIRKGVEITDTVNRLSITLKPRFGGMAGKQQGNRIVYPIYKGNGSLVYTAQSNGVKEDILLDHFTRDELSFDYDVVLTSALEARLLDDGSLGIFGSDLPINGDVSTSTDKDRELVEKARQNAKKTKLLFALPAPVIKETGRDISRARAKFSLPKKNILRVTATELDKSIYPLTIDPSVAVTAISDFFRDMNPDMNVQFDATNNRINRSLVGGGNIAAWTQNPTNNLNTARMWHGAVAYNGYTYVVGGLPSDSNVPITGTNLVEYAQISTGSPATIGAWSATTNTGLPASGLVRMGIAAYNGYIYVFGGSINAAGGSGNAQTAIYYSRVQPNGSLGSWSTASASLPTGKFSFGSTVYNGYLYALGGKTGADASNATTEVVYCAIAPSGNVTACTVDTNSPLAIAVYGNSAEAYNGRIYTIAGNESGTLNNTVRYAALNKDGSISPTVWTGANNTGLSARESFGPSFTTIVGGYLYAFYGCSAVNANQVCTNARNSINLTQINADGNLGEWSINTGGSDLDIFAGGVVSWNNTIYYIGGCVSTMDTTILKCSSTNIRGTQQYSAQDTPGGTSEASGDNDLITGLFGHATVALNGYLYVIGGCQTNSCNGTRAASNRTYYAAIGGDGSITAFAGVDTNTRMDTTAAALNFQGESTPVLGSADCNAGATSDQCGLAGLNAVVYSGRIYAFGGYDGAAWSNGVWYVKPHTDGSFNAGAITWTKSASNMVNAGGQRAAFVNGGFIYTAGGCTGTAGIGCTTYLTTVQRSSSINASTGDPGTWATTNQLQLASGRAIMGAAFYGGFIYLAGGSDATAVSGGVPGGGSQLRSVLFAKVDSSNNIVDADGETVVDNIWTTTSGSMVKERRRSAAFAANGYVYVVTGHSNDDDEDDTTSTDQEGTADDATYNTVEVGKINLSTGDIASFSLGDTTVTARWNGAVTFHNGRAHITGGCTAGAPPSNCTTRDSLTTQKFQVYNADSFGFADGWNDPDATTYATDRVGGEMVAANGYLYLVGGCTSFNLLTNGCAATTDDTAYVPINPDGTLGTWVSYTTSGSLLPAGRTDGALVALNGTLYYMGGSDASSVAQKSIYYITEANFRSGNAWSTSARFLGQSGANSQCRYMGETAVYNNRIYYAGGWGSSVANATACSGAANFAAVYYSPALPSGGDITSDWGVATSFTTARREPAVAIAGGFMYVMGGWDGSSWFNDVQVGNIDESTGNISAWTYTADLPNKVGSAEAIAANGYIYVMGGRDGTGSTNCKDAGYYASVSGNGNLGEWSHSGDIGNERLGFSVDYYNGFVYAVGGFDCTQIISAGTQKVRSAGVASPPILSRFSRYMDFNGDATPRKMLMNGTHFAISSVDIDKWKLRYRSSREATNTWGIPVTTTNGNTAGLNFPGANATNDASVGTIAWSGLGNIQLPDNNRSSAAMTNGATSNYLVTSTFGFSLPNCSAIEGIQVFVERSTNNTPTARDSALRLVKGGVIGGNSLADTTTTWPTTDGTASYGGSSELWGQTWTCADIESAGFGTALSAFGLGTAGNARVDTISMAVYYTASSLNADNSSSVTFGSLMTSLPAYDSSSVDQGVARWWLLTYYLDLTTTFTFTDDTQPAITDYEFWYSPATSKRLRNGRDFRDQTKQGLDARP